MVVFGRRDASPLRQAGRPSLRVFDGLLNNGQLDAALDDARADGVAGESSGVVEVELRHEMLAVLLGEGRTEERSLSQKF